MHKEFCSLKLPVALLSKERIAVMTNCPQHVVLRLGSLLKPYVFLQRYFNSSPVLWDWRLDWHGECRSIVFS